MSSGDNGQVAWVILIGFKAINTHTDSATKGELEFINLTDTVREAVAKSGIRNGIVLVFSPHATRGDYPY